MKAFLSNLLTRTCYSSFSTPCGVLLYMGYIGMDLTTLVGNGVSFFHSRLHFWAYRVLLIQGVIFVKFDAILEC